MFSFTLFIARTCSTRRCLENTLFTHADEHLKNEEAGVTATPGPVHGGRACLFVSLCVLMAFVSRVGMKGWRGGGALEHAALFLRAGMRHEDVKGRGVEGGEYA